MKKQRIVFRADASKHIGYGHFVRSLALANYLRDDFDCIFASFNKDSVTGLITEYQRSEIQKISSPADVFGRTKSAFDEAFISELKPDDIVVLDNYYYDTEYQRRIKDKGCRLVCIDDMHQYHMVCDLLLTVSPLKQEAFSIEPYTKFAGGIEWAFLREPFLKPMRERSINTYVGKVVMAMGGADAFNLSDKMVGIISSVIPQAHVDLICGETATVSNLTYNRATVHKSLTAEEIVRLFDAADFGIFSASTICLEAFARKLPVVAGYYVDNQKEFYDYGFAHGYFAGLGNLQDDANDLSNRLKTILKSNFPHPIIIDFRSQRNKIIELFKSL